MAGIKGLTLLLRSSSDRIVFKFWHLINIVMLTTLENINNYKYYG